jgi:hypothetical protein
MAQQERAVTRETLGAWLIKTSPSATPVDELVRTGFAAVTGRCVQPTYRAEVVAAGQPVLLWISGNDARHPAGVYAEGYTTGPAEPEAVPPGEVEEGGRPGLVMPIRLTPLDPPILRRQLDAHPLLSGLEVLRMPAGSNPSFLTRVQLRELATRFPQLTVG